MKYRCILVLLITFSLSVKSQEWSTFRGDTSQYPYLREKIAQLTDSLKLKPDADLFFMRGSLYFDVEDWENSAVDFSNCILLNADRFEPYYKRGGAYHRLGRFTDAYTDYTRVIELNPAFPWGYLDRGIILNDAKIYADALKDFRQALIVKPHWGAAVFCIGECFADQKETDSAMFYYRLSVQYDSNQYKAYNNMGIYYNKNEQYDTAIELFNKAIAIWPQYTMALTNRAEAKYYKGDVSGACQDMQKAISLGRTDKIEVYNRYCK